MFWQEGAPWEEGSTGLGKEIMSDWSLGSHVVTTHLLEPWRREFINPWFLKRLLVQFSQPYSLPLCPCRHCECTESPWQMEGPCINEFFREEMSSQPTWIQKTTREASGGDTRKQDLKSDKKGLFTIWMTFGFPFHMQSRTINSSAVLYSIIGMVAWDDGCANVF